MCLGHLPTYPWWLTAYTSQDQLEVRRQDIRPEQAGNRTTHPYSKWMGQGVGSESPYREKSWRVIPPFIKKDKRGNVSREDDQHQLSLVQESAQPMLCAVGGTVWQGLPSSSGLVAKSRLTTTTLWTGACWAPLSMGIPRQEYQSGLPFPSPRDLPNPGLLHCRWIPYQWSQQGSLDKSTPNAQQHHT